MATSEARILANRANAQMSTGPKTADGKKRSRANGLKHGLTGAGIVVADEVRDEIAQRFEALQAELGPKSTLGSIMVGQMATLSVRMERGARQESAAIATRVRHAGEAFDRARLDEVDRLFDGLGDSPRITLRKLLKSPEGVDRLILAWQELRAGLTLEGRSIWTDSQIETAVKLSGLRMSEAQGSRIVVLSKAIRGDFAALEDHEGSHLAPEDRKLFSRGRLVERIDEEIADLETLYETLDFETIDLDRAEAADIALFDPSKEATLARRYESEARRGFFKALKEFKNAEAEAAERAEMAPEPVEEIAQPREPLASSWEGPSPTIREPQPASNQGSSARNQPLFDRDGQPLRSTGPAPKAG